MRHRSVSVEMIIGLVWGCLIGFIVAAVYLYNHPEKLVVSTPAPSSDTSNLELTAGECFVHNGQLEPWEPWYEGQVLQVGYKKYLVQSSDARLKHQYDGRYQGIEIPKRDFERTFHKVDCPKLWRK